MDSENGCDDTSCEAALSKKPACRPLLGASLRKAIAQQDPGPTVNHAARALARFCQFNAANILYGASALCILYGMVLVIGPTLGTSHNILDLLPAYGALSLYQLALFGGAALLFCRKAITDDTVSLVVLATLFVGACAITLATLAPEDPGITWGAGAFGCALVVLQGGMLWRALRIGPWGLLAPAAACLVAGMFLLPAAAAEGMVGDRVGSWLRQMVTRDAWTPALAAGLMLLWQAWRTRAACVRRHASPADGGGQAKVCFLHGEAMPWVVGGILFLTYAPFMLAMGEVFSVSMWLPHFLPYILLLVLVVHELLTAMRVPGGVGVLAVPLVLMLGIGFSRHEQYPGEGLLLLWHKPFLCAFAALWLGGTAAATADRYRAGAALAYAVVALATFQVQGISRDMNIFLAGGGLFVAMVAGAIYWRSCTLAFIATCMACLFWGRIHPGSCVFGGAMLFVALHAIFPNEMPRAYVFICAVVACISLHFMRVGEGERLVLGIVASAIAGVVWWRSRWMPLLLPFAGLWGTWIYLTLEAWLGQAWAWGRDAALTVEQALIWAYQRVLAVKGWLFVGFSFVLLGSGIWMSAKRKPSDK